jgi:hypothetical protein
VALDANDILAAAQETIRAVSRSVLAPRRQRDPATDVPPDKAVYALVLWASQDAGHPAAYRPHGTLLVPQPRGERLYVSAAGTVVRAINFALEPTGRVVWTVTDCTVQGRKSTMLLGAVRLKSGEWSLFRQIASERGGHVIFQTDVRWYSNRLRRVAKHG